MQCESAGTSRSRRGRAALLSIWAATNVVLGCLLAYPLLFLGLFLLSEIWHVLPSPFDAGEVTTNVLVLIVVVTPMITAATGINLALRRRLAPPGRYAVVFWVVTTLVLLAPLGLVLVYNPTI